MFPLELISLRDVTGFFPAAVIWPSKSCQPIWPNTFQCLYAWRCYQQSTVCVMSHPQTSLWEMLRAVWVLWNISFQGVHLIMFTVFLHLLNRAVFFSKMLTWCCSPTSHVTHYRKSANIQLGHEPDFKHHCRQRKLTHNNLCELLQNVFLFILFFIYFMPGIWQSSYKLTFWVYWGVLDFVMMRGDGGVSLWSLWNVKRVISFMNNSWSKVLFCYILSNLLLPLPIY